jgi:hypothetical protein
MLLLTAFFAYSSAKALASDKIRVKNVALLGQFLSAYKKNEGSYPASFGSKPIQFENYLQFLPIWPDGSCNGKNLPYEYSTRNNNLDFSLSFCLIGSVSGFKKGINIIGPADLIK